MPTHPQAAFPHDPQMHFAAPPVRRQRGAIAILAVILLPILLMVSAFAVDIANLMLVKNELQNAADSAAQTGAQCLYPRAECFNTLSTTPDWATSQTRASLAVTQNAAQGAALVTGVVTSGYWNVTGTPNTLQLLPHTPTANEAPAIQVTISKQSGKNGGGVVLYLAGLMGFATSDLTATAVSVVTSPGVVPPGGLFPFTMAQCMYDGYWNSSTNQPKLFQAGDIDYNNITQTIGEPWVFHLANTDKKTIFYTPDHKPCTAGQWSTLADDQSGGASIIDSYIPQTGKKQSISPQLAVKDWVYVRTGTTTDLYQHTQECSYGGTGVVSKKCEYVRVLVTNTAQDGSREQINAFGCVRILNADPTGNPKYITVQMSTACPPYGGGIGPNYGLVNPPQLAL